MPWSADVREQFNSMERPKGIDQIDDFWIYCGNLQTAFPEWRKGQVYFNALCRVRPDLSRQVYEGEGLDTYYEDERISAFVDWLYAHWTERQPVMLSIQERDTILSALAAAESAGDITFLKACDVSDKLYDMEFESEV